MLKKHFLLFYIFFQFDDFFAFKFLNIFFQPSRLLIIVGIFLFLIDVIKNKIKTSFTPYEKFILIYSIIHILSLTMSKIGILTLLNYFLYDLFFLFFVLSKDSSINLIYYFKKSKFLWIFLLFFNILLFVFSLLSTNISNFLYNFYGRIMYGIFLERLYFSFALISAVHVLVYIYKPNFINKTILISISSICVIGSLSFSGVLALLTFIPYFIKGKINFLFKFFALVVIVVVSTLVFQGKILSTSSELESASIKSEKYFSENMTESNWRIYSSIFLVESFVNNSTFIGHGFRENWFYLKDLLPNSDDDKYVSSHTFLSLIYDSGYLGLFLIMFFFYSVYSSIRVRNFFNLNNELGHLFFLNNVFFILILIHFFFYYQEYLPILYLFPVFLKTTNTQLLNA